MRFLSLVPPKPYATSHYYSLLTFNEAQILPIPQICFCFSPNEGPNSRIWVINPIPTNCTHGYPASLTIRPQICLEIRRKSQDLIDPFLFTMLATTNPLRSVLISLSCIKSSARSTYPGKRLFLFFCFMVVIFFFLLIGDVLGMLSCLLLLGVSPFPSSTCLFLKFAWNPFTSPYTHQHYKRRVVLPTASLHCLHFSFSSSSLISSTSMSDLPAPSFADVVRSPRHSHPILLNAHRPSSSATSPMDHHSGAIHPPSPTVVQSVGSDSHCAPPSPPQSGDTSPVISDLPNTPTPSVTVPSPTLDDSELQLFRSSCLFGKVWGDPIPIASVISRLRQEWAFIQGEVSLRYLSNGWFLIRFTNSLDKADVWDRRPWFVQGLNFVLLPWKPLFKPFSNSITQVDQWVKIPFLPNEFWSVTHLTTLTQKVGRLIKLDKFTQQNDDKAQFARVCLNIDISKPVPRSITMTSASDSSEFFLTYEGVHEVCPLCGAKDHFLNLCPSKPAPCLDLIVAKLESSNIASTADSDWISVRPQRRQRSRLPHRTPRQLPYKHLPALKPIPSLLCPETLPPDSPPHAFIQPPPPTLHTTNAFATLSEFQISCDELGLSVAPSSSRPLLC